MNSNYKFIHQALILILIATVVSCNVAKPYQAPALSLPETYRDATYGDTASIAHIPWNDFFTDDTLRALISHGIQYNFDLQLAVKRIDIAQQQLYRARNLQLPTVSLGVSGQYNRPSKNSLTGLSIGQFAGQSHIEDYIANINLAWEADIWGKIRSQQKLTGIEYLRSYEAKKAIQTKLVSSIAIGYYNLLMLDEQLRVANASYRLADSTVSITRILKKSGSVTSLSVEQTDAQKQEISALILQLQQDIALQENALSELTGQYPRDISRQRSLAIIQTPPITAGIPAAIVSQRPDVRAYEMDIMSANQKVGIAQANMYPSLTITASSGLEALRTSNWFSIPGSLFGIATASLVQPLINKRTLKTNFEVAKIEREQSVILFRQSVVSAVTEVSNALIQLKKWGERGQVAASRADTLAKATRNAALLYRSGMANYLEVILAQNNYLQAQLDVAATHCQELIAAVNVYKSVGGGWQ